MILTRAINAPRRDGLGEDVSLDALLRRHATINPDAPAMIDTADRPVFTDGKPRRMSWAALDVEVDRIAAGLKGLNLGRDAVVAVQMPNITESAVAFLAVLRAGYIPSMLPLGWRRREIVQALTRTGAKAVITVSRAGPVAHAEIMAYAAAEVFTVRFLLAYGRTVPDGVISIDTDLDGLKRADQETVGDRLEKSGRHVGVITWDPTPSGFAPVARAQNELIAAGMAYMLEAGLTDRDIIATTLSASAIVGLASGIVASLLSGAPLVMHQPFSSRVLAGALVTENVTHLVLPGAVVAGFIKAARLPSRPLRSVGAVWRTGETPAKLTPGTHTIIDVSTFGEIGFTAAARDASYTPVPLPLGELQSPRGNTRGPSLIETRITPKGHVVMRGALAPSGNLPGEPSLAIDNEGWVDTGVTAGVRQGEVRIGTVRMGVARIGALSFPRAALEEFLRTTSSSAGAALALTRDQMFGEITRAGNGNRKALFDALDKAGASAALLPRSEGEERRQQGVA
ncbi:hypothetical protein IZ6_16880 [Terrihabitans soli]|uniref:AMP-dependent synthetase/ligase domain-containing protein n=1 Tax=Terrihabitans soli TaxID=708113 RepID=A0A6S6QI88_9HYPH|nr:class I adenylate-forming enzyme family protein [Terrihabitans soli]BCJ90953.1 hypothetical protein IZ6_16880 [Terrihabitans soli]